MDIFDILSLIGGLSLFLFGMELMGQALERRAGSELRFLLRKLTTNKLAGLLTGLGVTAVIQSSSATTVMVVGFVNSGLMSLKQAIHVIMGANIGTTVTAWILSLGGIESDNFFIQMLKPTSFTPILALAGIIFYMFCKDSKKKDTGTILLGFATLMFGMDAMSGAVSGLADVPEFQQLFLLFKNPILGMLAGAVLTAIIQSSSASVGILQALAVTGQVSYGAAIPIIMGQNIGTCITAILSSIGANKNARRAALVHLFFNIIGTCVWLTVFSAVNALLHPALFDAPASLWGIAVAHSAFNIACVTLMLPQSRLLETLVCRLVPDDKKPQTVEELDERLLATPSVALERCRTLTADMARCACEAMKGAMSCVVKYDSAAAQAVRDLEDKTDHYEDILSTYLVKLSAQPISAADNAEAAGLLKLIGDFERIADHSVNILGSAEELREKEITFAPAAAKELGVLTAAITEVLDLADAAFAENDLTAAAQVEPLEQVIDKLRDQMRDRHIRRLQKKESTIEVGFIWSDLLTSLERVSDHCSNVAGCMIDMAHNNLNLHESLRLTRASDHDYARRYEAYGEKYALAPEEG
ncbi:MAG: Na/Pi cotransporter family protein [Oscillibacter sp.]|nr:Na/Pi cotransporter family protein [Oscillibacter sp.]